MFVESSVQLSCLATTADFSKVAVGEGTENPQESSLVYLYDMEKRRLHLKLTFHQKGIQSMSFSACGRFLITLGVREDKLLAVWDLQSGLVASSAHMAGYAHNAVKVNPFVTGDRQLQFVTVGNNAKMSIWNYDYAQDPPQLVPQDVLVPENLQGIHFCSIDFTHYLPAPVSNYYVVVGGHDGSLITYDQ